MTDTNTAEWSLITSHYFNPRHQDRISFLPFLGHVEVDNSDTGVCLLL